MYHAATNMIMDTDEPDTTSVPGGLGYSISPRATLDVPVTSTTTLTDKRDTLTTTTDADKPTTSSPVTHQSTPSLPVKPGLALHHLHPVQVISG